MKNRSPKLIGFDMKPDLGKTKTGTEDYLFLQNIRGRGKLGFKRNSVKNVADFSSSVMGMFDLKEDDDPLSIDSFLVITRDELFTLFTPTDFLPTFDILFAIGSHWYLQSDNGAWWEVTQSNFNQFIVTGVAAPASYISYDLLVAKDQLFGFKATTGIGRVYVDRSQSYPQINIQQYNLSGASITYTSTIAFETGYGFVFEDSTLEQWRMFIDNSGSLSIISV